MPAMNGITIFRMILIILFITGFSAIININCSSKNSDGKRTVTLVFKHGKISGDPESFRMLLQKFEELNPGITVKDETLPSSTDEQHQFYAINLEGGRADFDVLSMDVIWVPEFSRAGLLLEVTGVLFETEKRDMFPGPLEAAVWNDRLYSLPWYIDAGLLFYRSDILKTYGFSPPRTWMDLVSISKAVLKQKSGIYGFIWQGKQYEGIVCNTLEFIWGAGGDILGTEGVVIDSKNQTVKRVTREGARRT